jgi:DNA-binding transcriptional ArsR family regulator
MEERVDIDEDRWRSHSREILIKQISEAFSHTTRVSMLRLVMCGREVSAKQLCEAAGVNIRAGQYHVEYLNELGYIGLSRKKQVRGAVRHSYQMPNSLRPFVRDLVAVLDKYVGSEPSHAA